jgi:hypothetical protein
MSKTAVWRVLYKSFLVINVCHHGEHYETPCILVHLGLAVLIINMSCIYTVLRCLLYSTHKMNGLCAQSVAKFRITVYVRS